MSGRDDVGGNAIERGEVRRAFGRAAATYDAAAELQRRVRDELLSRLDYVKLEPAAVLDLGAGTGHATLALKRRYPASTVVALDLAESMLREARRSSTSVSGPNVVKLSSPPGRSTRRHSANTPSGTPHHCSIRLL